MCLYTKRRRNSVYSQFDCKIKVTINVTIQYLTINSFRSCCWRIIQWQICFYFCPLIPWYGSIQASFMVYVKYCARCFDWSDNLRMVPSRLIIRYIVATVLISDVQRRVSELPLFFCLHIIADSTGRLTSDIHISWPSLSIIHISFPIHIYFVRLKYRYFS